MIARIERPARDLRPAHAFARSQRGYHRVLVSGLHDRCSGEQGHDILPGSIGASVWFLRRHNFPHGQAALRNVLTIQLL